MANNAVMYALPTHHLPSRKHPHSVMQLKLVPRLHAWQRPMGRHLSSRLKQLQWQQGEQILARFAFIFFSSMGWVELGWVADDAACCFTKATNGKMDAVGAEEASRKAATSLGQTIEGQVTLPICKYI